eukprot:CAMPEP_0183823912 /NCGR_PEP_ID=MMETSP0807_2-20130328/303_1 /TAXON_ID=88271 /ORGANISM="Picocystis salinarum, Strain CCMP1897" /LENGTH=1288 /DNA_ID=CAMNT_0026068819 /DNA_START=328 /DNA_END=4191 /DNA_ORIENTATION=-
MQTRQSPIESVWTKYKANSIPTDPRWGAKGDLYEELNVTRLQDLVSLPELTYQPLLLDRIQEASLSRAQVEAIVHACQTFEHRLQNDVRSAFFLADGTGCGKGRSIAGLIFENYLQGRGRSIWLSANDDLRKDAERDVSAIIPTELDLPILSLDQFDAHLEEPVCGVLFLSYSMLRQCIPINQSSSTSRSAQRFAKVQKWLTGKNFEGVIALDEAHRVKNTKSLQGRAALSMQREFPKARIVYASATAVNDVEEIEYMERLGLWNNGENKKMLPASFQDFNKLIIGGMIELLSLSLKMEGQFVSRTLSYEGIDYQTMTVSEPKMTRRWKPLYERCVGYWTQIRKEIVNPAKAVLQSLGTFLNACKDLKPGQHGLTEEGMLELNSRVAELEGNLQEHNDTIVPLLRPLNSEQQRFFKELLFAMKVDDIVNETIKYVKEGSSVVIGVQSTSEALILKAHQVKIPRKEFTSPCGELIKRWVQKETEVPLIQGINTLEQIAENLVEWLQTNLSDAQEIHRSLIAWKEAQRSMKILQHGFASVKVLVTGESFPLASLDALIERLGGHEAVAELTGRRYMEVKRSGTVHLTPIGKKNKDELLSFTEGRKQIAVISRAASTGFSLHSDKAFKNQKPRVHIVAELPWSAIELIQQLGRTHRANEAKKPKYVFCLTTLSGETRFVATLIRRLHTLGATSQGDYNAHRPLDVLGGFDAETTSALAALNDLWKQLQDESSSSTGLQSMPSRQQMKEWKAALEDAGFTFSQNAKGMQNFLNALLATTPLIQEGLFQSLEEIYLDHIFEQGNRSAGPQWIHDSGTTVKGDFHGEIIVKDGTKSIVQLVSLFINPSWAVAWDTFNSFKNQKKRVCFKTRRREAERNHQDIPRTCLCVEGRKPITPTGFIEDSMCEDNEKVWIKVKDNDKKKLDEVKAEWIKQQRGGEEAFVLHGSIIPVAMLWDSFLKDPVAKEIFDDNSPSLENTCTPVVGKLKHNGTDYSLHGLKVSISRIQKERFVSWAASFVKKAWKKKQVPAILEPATTQSQLPACRNCNRIWGNFSTVCLLPDGSWYCAECVTDASKEPEKFEDPKNESKDPIDYWRIGTASAKCTFDEFQNSDGEVGEDAMVDQLVEEGSNMQRENVVVQQNLGQNSGQDQLAQLERKMREKEGELQEKDEKLKKSYMLLQEKDEKLKKSNILLHEKERELKEVVEELKGKNRKLKSMEEMLREKDKEVKAIGNVAEDKEMLQKKKGGDSKSLYEIGKLQRDLDLEQDEHLLTKTKLESAKHRLLETEKELKRVK